ncbi:NAD-dependent epimerase/dehydratase family protein [Alistipes sp. ZOR0009]|uniref:NAD-dependent epimerase/dehydratase family protein n=1 Tax=Alistipes sp. ZOR0009 TaxID=1339253 RepID=UPI000647A91E|nr:NAD(P)-dependent oxidoreductase [Alistipes sp. ZOR0009]
MKVVITGAAGFVGSLLVVELAKNRNVHEVVAYDNLSSGSFDYLFSSFEGKSKVRVVLGDILDGRSLDAACLGADVVVHSANIKLAADPHQFDQVNCWGTAEVVAAFERSKASKLLMVSSIAIFGTVNNADDLKPNPASPYEWSLLRAEEHVMRLVKQERAVILRLGDLCGVVPSRMASSRINSLVFRAAIGDKLDIFGSGDAVVNITDAESVAAEVNCFLEGKLKSGAYNLVDYTLSSLELVDSIRNEYPELEVIFVSHHYDSKGIPVAKSGELCSSSGEISAAIKKIKKALL